MTQKEEHMRCWPDISAQTQDKKGVNFISRIISRIKNLYLNLTLTLYLTVTPQASFY